MGITLNQAVTLSEETTIIENVDMIFPVVANDLCFVPFFAEPITEFYKENKLELYELAKSSPYYNYTIFEDKRLYSEITMRRIFAVLLIAKERDDARELFISLFKDCPKTKTLVQYIENGNLKGCESIIETALRSYENIDRNLVMTTCLYYTYLFYGDIGSNSFAKSLDEYVYSNTFSRFLDCHSLHKNRIDAVKVHDHVKLIRECRKAFEYIQSGEQVLELLDIGTGWFNPAVHSKLSAMNMTLDKIVKISPAYKDLLYTKRTDLALDMPSAMGYIKRMCKVFDYNDLSISTYFQDIKLTEEDKTAIVKMIAECNSEIGTDYITFYDYVMFTCFYIITKIFKETRDFYMTNNPESEFFELQHIINQNEILNKMLAELENKNSIATAENDRLNSIITELKKPKTENHEDILRPYLQEIELLKAKVSSLQSTLETKEKESQELYRLRELAFDLKQGDYVPESKKELSDLLNGRKVVMVGGHINLRNKLSEKYPELTILDGHNASVSDSVFANADLVLFNTSNMSHAVYYKVIDVLRTHGIKFDYLGRVINPELFENELIRIVEKQFL